MDKNVKILDKDTAEYLIEFVGEEVVRDKQYKVLKERMKDYLQSIIYLFEKERYEELRKLSFDSGSGDGYGQDNTCIDFSDVFNTKSSITDFGEAIDWLQRLRDKDYLRIENEND